MIGECQQLRLYQIVLVVAYIRPNSIYYRTQVVGGYKILQIDNDGAFVKLEGLKQIEILKSHKKKNHRFNQYIDSQGDALGNVIGVKLRRIVLIEKSEKEEKNANLLLIKNKNPLRSVKIS